MAFGPFNPRCTVGAGNNGTGDNGTAIQDRQAWVDGFADNVPADHKIRVAIGTTPGGPYFPGGVWLSTGVNGNNTVNQRDTTSHPAYGMLPSTTYYLVTQVWDAGNNVVAQSSECTFTTLAAPTYLNRICAGMLANPLPHGDGFSGGYGRNRFLLTFISDDMPVMYVDDRFVLEVSTSPSGPWTAADTTNPGGGSVPNTLGPLTTGFSSIVRVPTHNTDYYFRVTLKNIGANQAGYPNPNNIQQVVCGPFHSADYPTLKCATSSSGVTRGFHNIHGLALGLTFKQPVSDWNVQTYLPGPDILSLHWGTTPGGPYPNIITATPGRATVDFPTGTAPPCGTPIYYKTFAAEQIDSHGIYATSPECSITTLCSSCIPASNVTGTSATINAGFSSTFGGIPSGQRLRIAWGTTPGGPYPNLGPAVPGNGMSPQNISLPVTGLTQGTTYYYVLQVSSNGSGPFTLLDESPECNFKTPLVVTDPPTGVTNQCAVLQGTSPSNNPGCTYIFDYSKTSGGPYDHIVVSTNSTGGVDTFQSKVCGLDPNTKYFYRTRIVCGVDTVSTGTEQSFTTQDGIWYCGTLFTPGSCVGVDINGDGTIDYFYCH